MNDRTIRHLLLTALVLMAAAALYLHLRIHPFLVAGKANAGQTLFMGSFLAASIFPLLDLVVVRACSSPLAGLPLTATS